MPLLVEIKCATTDPKVLSSFSSPGGDCQGEAIIFYSSRHGLALRIKIWDSNNWKERKKKI